MCVFIIIIISNSRLFCWNEWMSAWLLFRWKFSCLIYLFVSSLTVSLCQHSMPSFILSRYIFFVIHSLCRFLDIYRYFFPFLVTFFTSIFFFFHMFSSAEIFFFLFPSYFCYCCWCCCLEVETCKVMRSYINFLLNSLFISIHCK